MKGIAHVMPFPEIGGTELQTLRIVKVAAELGFKNRVYFPAGAAVVGDLFRSEGFETESYPQVPPSYRRPGPFLRASSALARSFRSHGIGVVHCADILAGMFAGLAGRLAGARVISHVRNPYPDLTRRERSFLWPVQSFIFVSKDVQRQLCLAPSRKKGPVIYGVPAAIFESKRDPAEARRKFGLPADAPVIGTAARLAPQKDYETLIRAARIVKRDIPGVRFLVAADIEGTEQHREYFRTLQRLLEETGTRDAFVFAGFQPEMSWFFAAIDAFALSSNFEGLGSVLLEAIQQRKPIAATDVGGIPEAVIDGRTGLLAPPKSPEVLAEKLLRLLKEPALGRTLVQGAGEHFEKSFGRDRFVRQYENLYSKLLK